MRFREIRQLNSGQRRSLDLQRRQSLIRSRQKRDSVLLAHHDQTEPGTQSTLRIRLYRSKEPGKIRTIEVDRGKTMWLEIRSAGERLEANHLLRIDAGNITRAVE